VVGPTDLSLSVGYQVGLPHNNVVIEGEEAHEGNARETACDLPFKKKIKRPNKGRILRRPEGLFV